MSEEAYIAGSFKPPLSDRVLKLEVAERNNEKFRADVESRLRVLEKTVWRATGTLAALQLLLRYVL